MKTNNDINKNKTEIWSLAAAVFTAYPDIISHYISGYALGNETT